VALAWRSSSAHRVRKTLISSRPLVLSRPDCDLRLPFFKDLDPADQDAWVHYKRDNLEAFVNRDGVVKVAFFGGLDTLRRDEDPRRAAGSRVWVASLIDLAGMKMRVIQVRGSWKDYVDIHTLVTHGVERTHRIGGGPGDRPELRSITSIRGFAIFMAMEH